MTTKPRQRPEALAQFAEAARTDSRKERPGLTAKEATSPLPTDSKAKDEAATKVLQEGVTGVDHGAEEAIDRLPDRIIESRHSGAQIEQEDEPESNTADREPYDATTDPRTGRPPLPIEADELSKERELQQLRNAQLSEGEEDMDLDETEIEVTLEDEEDPAPFEDQAPGRMVPPTAADRDDETEKG